MLTVINGRMANQLFSGDTKTDFLFPSALILSLCIMRLHSVDESACTEQLCLVSNQAFPQFSDLIMVSDIKP